MAKPVKLDIEEVNALLDIVLKTISHPSLKAISETAMNELSKINADLEAELRPPPEEPEVEGDV